MLPAMPIKSIHDTTSARYEYEAEMKTPVRERQQYNNWVEDGIVLAFTALWLIPLLYVTIRFLTT